MANTIIQDIVTSFDTATATFLASSAGVVSNYILPVAWILLAVTLLVYTIQLQTGKETSINVQGQIWNYILAIIILWLMSGGYTTMVAEPITDIADSLANGLSGGGDAIDSLKALNAKIINLTSAISGAFSEILKLGDIGSAFVLGVFGIVAFITAYLLLATSFFFIIFAQLGLTLVLAVGPFFLFFLLNSHMRNYFFPWLNTAFYFVFYKVLTILFINLFLAILTTYITALETQLAGVTWSIGGMIETLVTGQSEINVIAIITPIILISLTMFFMLLQLPTIASSMTSGSGGAFGNGLYAMSQIFRNKKNGNDSDSGNKSDLQLQPRK